MTAKLVEKNTAKAKSIAELGEKLGYSFQNIQILALALVHKSFGNEFRASEKIEKRDNERLEFLGDAVLDLLISHLLLEHYPESTEGDLSKLRASIVNEKTLARLARAHRLGEYIQLGKGEEQTGGREKDSILSSTLEAIVAAVYLDGGFESAQKWSRKIFDELIASSKAGENESLQRDYKTQLQEIVQARFKSAPRYELVQSSGPDHEKCFDIQLKINGKIVARSEGRSKKQAEQNAAKIALEKLENDKPENKKAGK